jgi:hypothetical protein
MKSLFTVANLSAGLLASGISLSAAEFNTYAGTFTATITSLSEYQDSPNGSIIGDDVPGFSVGETFKGSYSYSSDSLNLPLGVGSLNGFGAGLSAGFSLGPNPVFGGVPVFYDPNNSADWDFSVTNGEVNFYALGEEFGPIYENLSFFSGGGGGGSFEIDNSGVRMDDLTESVVSGSITSVAAPQEVPDYGNTAVLVFSAVASLALIRRRYRTDCRAPLSRISSRRSGTLSPKWTLSRQLPILGY